MQPRDRIIRSLLAKPEGLGLTDVAAAVGMTGAPALHHLKALMEEGAVEKFVPEDARRPRYRLRPFLSVTWIDPASGTHASWVSRAAVDWRHPLVSRLPSPAAQASVLAFFRLCDEAGLLRPREKRARRSQSRDPAGEDARRRRGLRLVAYGSAARGDMGPRSDVDLIALLGPGLDDAFAEALRDAAAEANLATTALRIDLHVFREGEMAKLAPRLAANVEREGFVIHASYEGGATEPILREAAP